MKVFHEQIELITRNSKLPLVKVLIEIIELHARFRNMFTADITKGQPIRFTKVRII